MKDVVYVTTNNLVDILSKSFIMYIQDDNIKGHPPVFITGSYGTGKSSVVLEIKNRIESISNKKVNLISDDILKINSNEINILFIKELESSLFTCDDLKEKILERKLKNTFIIVSKSSNKRSACFNEINFLLKNEFLQFEVRNSVYDWLTWAEENNVNDEIYDFIISYPNMLSNDTNKISNISITPKKWVMLSNMLNFIGGSVKSNKTIVEAFVCVELTTKIINNSSKSLLNLLYEGNFEELEKEASLEEIIVLLEEHVDDYYNDDEKIKQIILFIDDIPFDYGVRVFNIISNKIGLNINFIKNDLYTNLLKRMKNKL